MMNIIELLQSLEWQWEKTSTPCPCCGEGYKYGHSNKCELYRFLNQFKAAEHLERESNSFDYERFFRSILKKEVA